MKRHEQTNVPIFDPLTDSVPRTLLHPGHEGGIVDYAVEDLARGLCRVGLGTLLRGRARVRAAHLDERGWCL